MPEAPLCAQCGEPATVQRLTIRGLGREIFAQIVQLDHGLLATFVDLIRRPGSMIRDFIAGRRRGYTSPVSYALLAVGLSVLRAETLGKAQLLATKVRVATSAQLSGGQQESVAHVMAFLDGHRTVFMLATLVPIVVLLRALFDDRKYNIAEIATFACYTAGTATLIKLLLVLPGDLIPAIPWRPLPVFFLGAYLFWAGLDFFGRSFDTVWRFTVATLAGFFGFFFVVFVFITTFVR